MKKILYIIAVMCRRLMLMATAVFMVLSAGHAKAAMAEAPGFEDSRVWIYADGTAKVRTFDGVEASMKAEDAPRYHGKYRSVKPTRVSLCYVDGISGLEQVQPLARALDKYGIRIAVAYEEEMLDHMNLAEYRRAHVFDLGDGQYRFELNCEKKSELRVPLKDREYKTLSITGDLALMNKWIGMFDGHGLAICPQDMPWSDALSMARTAWKSGIEQVSVVFNDTSPAADLAGLNAYYQLIQNEKGPRTITVFPKQKVIAKKHETAVNVISRLNAAYTSDWLDKGERIQHPKSQHNTNTEWYHVTNVVRTTQETVLLFYAFQFDDLWLTAMTDDMSLKADGKEYKAIGYDGLSGYEERHFWSPDCGFYHFSVRFEALPEDVETADLVDSENGSILIRNLQVSNKQQAAREDVYNMILGNEYRFQTLHDNKPDIVKATLAELSQDETTVYMQLSITESRSFKGYVGSDFTLTFPSGRRLSPLRFEGVIPDQEFDRGGDDVNNYFQIVFPPSTPREWMLEGRPILEGVICHEPVSLEIVASLRFDGPDDIEFAEKALGIDMHTPPSSDEKPDEGE